jgi:hypothetical protein
MRFNCSSICRFLALASFTAAAAIYTRQAESNITLFVYGSDVIGAPLFYADGKM